MVDAKNIGNKIILPGAISILLIMFNIYLVNVVTGYDKRPEYPTYISPYPKLPSNMVNAEDSNTYEEMELERMKYDEEYAAVKERREKLAFRRHLGLLTIAIIDIIISILISNTYIKNGVGLAGLITLLFATGSYWTLYSDKIRLAVVSIGLIIMLFLAVRLYSARKSGEGYNVFDIKFLTGMD